jgi:hypothetical protein
MNLRTAHLLLLSAVCVLSGCTSFDHDWKKAGSISKHEGIQGRWEGTWTSQPSGHTGKLRSLVTKISDESYRARFDSTYKKVLHFKSTVVLNGKMTNEVFRFNGDAKLPWWAGGIYHYEGSASPTNFFSTYRCKYDHGTFQMTRPE